MCTFYGDDVIKAIKEKLAYLDMPLDKLFGVGKNE